MTAALSRQFSAATFPGACVAVVRDGALSYQHAFGFADVATRRPYTTDTVQPVGSVSKMVIGLALMNAVARGHVDLDTPINQWLDFRVVHPNWPRAPITLRQLATHTAGILDQPDAYEATVRFGSKRAAPPLHDYLKAYFVPGGRHYRPGNFASEAPGTAFHYSNIGAALAAHVIEAATGRPFDEFSAREVLLPLQMNDSGWFARADQAGRTATLYTPRRTAYPPYASITYPDGSLRTTCDDLSRWLVALARAAVGTPPPLNPAVDARALAPQFTDPNLPSNRSSMEPNQGLFFAWRRDGSVGHSGSDYGVSAFVFVNHRTGVGKLFMTNVDMQEEPELQRAFAAIWKTLGD